MGETPTSLQWLLKQCNAMFQVLILFLFDLKYLEKFSYQQGQKVPPQLVSDALPLHSLKSLKAMTT